MIKFAKVLRTTEILVAVLLIAWLTGCIGTAPQAVHTATQPAEVSAPGSYARTEALVNTAWAVNHLNDPNVLLIDVSDKPEAYDAGHLPGAQYVNWRTDLTNPDDPVRGQILTSEALSELMSRLGAESDNTIVLYDNKSNLFASRAYWVLKYYRHDDVRVYNGGSRKWTAAGQQLTTEMVPVEISQYVAKEPDPAIRTSWQYVVDHRDDPFTVFCDVRSLKEYQGTDVRPARAGHIPGAINLEWTKAVNPDGTFRDAAALAQLYREAGFTADKQIITYCQTGVRGAHTWFVLRELLGYPDVRNYDGGWEEYGSRTDSPIEP